MNKYDLLKIMHSISNCPTNKHKCVNLFKEIESDDKEFFASSDTPPEMLKHLAKDEDWYVRYYVARNILAPSTTLDQLATDWSPDIREAVVCNPATWTSTIKQRCDDSVSWVRNIAIKILAQRNL